MNIGIWELLLVLVVVLLLFGTGKLTRAMGDLARGLRSFKDGMKDAAPDEAATAARETPPPPALPAPDTGAPRGEGQSAGRHDQPARS